MDNAGWRPMLLPPGGGGGGGGAGGALDGGDWRAHLPPNSRERTVNKIMETLKRHIPVSGPEDLRKINRIAVKFEGNFYASATSRSYYLREISSKMLKMWIESQSTLPNAPSNSAGNSSENLVMHPKNQGRSQPIPNSLAVDQPQANQQWLVWKAQNNCSFWSSGFSLVWPAH